MTASVCYVGASPALASALPEMTEVVSPLPDRVEETIVERAELVFLDTDGLADVAQERMEERRERAAEARERAHELREEAHAARERADLARDRAHAERERAWEVATEGYAEGRRQWAAGRVEYARSRQQWADGRIEWAEGRVRHAEDKAKRKEAWATANAEWGAELGEAIGNSVAVAFASVPEVIEDCRYPDNPVTTIEKDGKTTFFVCDTAGDRLALKALEQARKGIQINDRLSDEMRKEILHDLDAEIRDLKRSVRS
jgi:hypothetical protein